MLRRQNTTEEEKHGGPSAGADDDEQVSFIEKTAPPSPINNNNFENSYPQNNGTRADTILNMTSSSSSSRSKSSSNSNNSRMILLTTLLSMVCGIVFVATSSRASSSSISGFATVYKSNSNRGNNGIIQFTCPASYDEDSTTSDSGESFEKYYASVSREITTNATEFLKNFRTTEFDEWGQTYDYIKEKSTPFKSKYYPKYLKSGMHIYESACGIGLNLYMTLEILKEFGGISDITVYGNEYVKESAEKAAQLVLSEGVIPAGNTQGIICAGDSSDLSYVPSGAFDLVYTGYLTPFQDPLQLYTDSNQDDWPKYDSICDMVKNLKRKNKKNSKYSKNNNKNENDNNDWMGQHIWEDIVQRQRDWYGKWVEEMARIAKPGVPVIVEQVSVPYCDYQNDWGGVNRTFWYDAARENTYNWNIDPDSIEMMDDTIHPTRYHVFMLKKE